MNVDIMNVDIILNNYLQEVQPFSLKNFQPFDLEEIQPFDLEDFQPLDLEEVELTNIDINIDIKPNPEPKIVKRARKVPVDEKEKDEKYYVRRKKNTLIASKNRKIKKENEKKNQKKNESIIKNLIKSNQELSKEINVLEKKIKILCKSLRFKYFNLRDLHKI